MQTVEKCASFRVLHQKLVSGYHYIDQVEQDLQKLVKRVASAGEHWASPKKVDKELSQGFEILSLEIFWEKVPQRRVTTNTIIKLFNVKEDIEFGLLVTFIILEMDLLNLQGAEEAFHGSIVVAIACPAHADLHVISRQVQPLTICRWCRHWSCALRPCVIASTLMLAKVRKHISGCPHPRSRKLQGFAVTPPGGVMLEGKRDWIILGLLLGAGLQRAELITITFDALKQQQTKDGKTRDVLQVTGYGAKDRVVLIFPLLAERLREWKAIVGGGNIARSYQNKKLGASISSVAVQQIVRK